MSKETTCEFCGTIGSDVCKTEKQSFSSCKYFLRKPMIPDNDFGFSFEEDNVATEHSIDTEILKMKLHALHKAILPFLDNLMKNPEKAIVWPNRVEKINEFKEKLRHIVEG